MLIPRNWGYDRLCEAHQLRLEEMGVFRVVAEFHTGAVLVVCAYEFKDAMVIDVDGKVCFWDRYRLALERGADNGQEREALHSRPRPAQAVPPTHSRVH
jgi:hypothetical protein